VARSTRQDTAVADADPAARRASARARGVVPTPQSEERSRNLRAIRRSDTKPEIRLRSLLHRQGLRFRKDHRIDLPDGVRVRPDVVFTRMKVAVFYDSCFWHACPDHGRRPAVNDWYWGPKLARTVQRDREATEALTRHGWAVVRIWEHDSLDDASQDVAGLVRQRRMSDGRATVDP
jgi:DNA mismatch endonuclease (patch repair protein)